MYSFMYNLVPTNQQLKNKTKTKTWENHTKSTLASHFNTYLSSEALVSLFLFPLLQERMSWSCCLVLLLLITDNNKTRQQDQDMRSCNKGNRKRETRPKFSVTFEIILKLMDIFTCSESRTAIKTNKQTNNPTNKQTDKQTKQNNSGNRGIRQLNDGKPGTVLYNVYINFYTNSIS